MASVTFDATLNTDKLNASIKESNKTVGDWAKGVEKGAGAMDHAIDKTLKQQKEAIKEQKEYIKGLMAEIKKLDEVANAATPGAMKREAVRNLKDAQRYLTEARADLNRLQSETIKLNENEEASENKIISALKRWGLGLLTITGAMKIFKEIIGSSNSATEEFGFTIDGVKGSLQQLSQSLIPAAGQTGNVIKNMIEGFKNAKELAKAIDQYNDSLTSNQVLEASEVKSLKELETIWRNASKDVSERKKALDDWIRIKKDAAARELEIEKNLNDALVKEIQNRPNLKAEGITKGQVESFATIYATNSDLIQKAEEYYKSLSGAEAAGYGVGVSEKTQKYYADLKKEIESLIPAGMQWNDVMTFAKINASLSDKQINSLKDSFIRLYETQAGGAEIEAEVARWLGAITNKAEKADEKINELNNQITEQTKLLEKAVTTGNDAEIKAITARIVELKKELELREKIARQIIAAAESEGFVPTQLPIPGMPTMELMYPKPKKEKPKVQKQWEDLQNKMTSLAPGGTVWAKNMQKAIDENDKKQIAALNEQLRIRNQIVDAATRLVFQIGQSLGLEGKELDQLNNYLNAFSQFVSGDIVGAVMSMVSSVIISFPSAAERYANEIERLNGLLAEQQRLIELSERKGGKKEALSGSLTLEQQILKENEEALAKAEYKLRHSSGGMFFNKRKKDVEELTQAVKDSKIAVEDAQQAYDDFLTGGITENTIADIIAEGFREGKTSVDDFADYMNQVLIDAVMSVFKAEYLLPAIAARFMPMLRSVMADNIITDEEKARLTRTAKDIADYFAPIWEGFTAVLDLGNGPQAGLSGQIARSITEETGSELAGLFRRFADDERAIKDYSKFGIDHLINIEANTFQTVEELKLAVVELQAINSNTKQTPTGDL